MNGIVTRSDGKVITNAMHDQQGSYLTLPPQQPGSCGVSEFQVSIMPFHG